MTKPLIFLDANILARPITRTFLWVGSQQDCFTITWSQLAEEEANKNLRPNATPIDQLRQRYGRALSATGSNLDRFAHTSRKDRQILSDAEASGASFLITSDVDDFGIDDLNSIGISAVQPDLFLRYRLSETAYLTALEALSNNSKNPPRTSAVVHARAGRLHPLLTARMAALFPNIAIDASTHMPPKAQFRGIACIACGRRLIAGDSMELGLGAICRLH